MNKQTNLIDPGAIDLVKRWKEAARRDDLFDHMVPSDVRLLLMEIEALRTRVAALIGCEALDCPECGQVTSTARGGCEICGANLSLKNFNLCIEEADKSTKAAEARVAGLEEARTRWQTLVNCVANAWNRGLVPGNDKEAVNWARREILNHADSPIVRSEELIALGKLQERVAEIEDTEREQRRLKEIYYNAGADCGAEAEAAEAREVKLVGALKKISKARRFINGMVYSPMPDHLAFARDTIDVAKAVLDRYASAGEG